MTTYINICIPLTFFLRECRIYIHIPQHTHKCACMHMHMLMCLRTHDMQFYPNEQKYSIMAFSPLVMF